LKSISLVGDCAIARQPKQQRAKPGELRCADIIRLFLETQRLVHEYDELALNEVRAVDAQ